jgi:hypothetical protein
VNRRWSSSSALVLAAAIGFFVWVSIQAWAGNPVTWESLLNLAVISLPFAGVYAMSASGLVVVYTTRRRVGACPRGSRRRWSC